MPTPNSLPERMRAVEISEYGKPEVLKAAIRRLTCKIELVPVLCGSAFKKKGVQVLLDAVVDYLPGPLDVPPAEGHEPGTENKVVVETNDNAKFCSLAFKLWTDPYAGKLVFFRVYSGTLKKGDTIYNPRTRKRERVSRLMIIQGSERKDIEQAFAGDIAARARCSIRHSRRLAPGRILRRPISIP